MYVVSFVSLFFVIGVGAWGERVFTRNEFIIKRKKIHQTI
uniref:Uncharacterized protein n=1 Tax=Arundo donax TaxID=35708 RepID=A0A0A8ZDM1_ARUDO